MSDLARGALLAQIRPADTLFATAFTAQQMGFEITRINICNTSGAAATFRLCHDVGGTTYDESNALWWDNNVNNQITDFWDTRGPGGGWHLDVGDSFGFRSSVASALTLTLYGVPQRVAENIVSRRQNLQR